MNINFDFWFPSHWVNMLAFDILSCNKTFCTHVVLTTNHTINLHQWKNTFCKLLKTNQMFHRMHTSHQQLKRKDKVILQQCGDNKRTKLSQGLLWHLKLRTRCLPQSKQTRIPGKTNCPVVYEEIFLEKEWHALLIAAVCFKRTQLQAHKKHSWRQISSLKALFILLFIFLLIKWLILIQ